MEGNYLYVAPSCELGQQTAEMLSGSGLYVDVINTKTNPWNVKSEIIRGHEGSA